MNERSANLELDDPSWSSFVLACPEATPFQHPTWTSLVSESYRLPGFVFTLQNAEGKVIAGLPIIEVGRRRRWVSFAFTDYFGALGDDDARARLLVALDRERRARNIPSLEIRDAVGAGAQSTVVGFRHVLALDRDSAETFKRFNSSQVQRGIKKAKKEGVRVRLGTSRDDLMTSFYSLHLATRRRLGVPIQPRVFFERLWERIIEPGFGTVFVAEVGGEPVAAAVFIGWRGMLIYKFGASDQSSWSHRPNHALFWEAIQWASENGFTTLDFGRTDTGNDGLRSFKAGWGTVESELVYSAFGAPAVARANGITSKFVNAVIRHSPDIVCRELGERFYRYAA